MIKSILVAVDGSAFTESVLRYAIYLAKIFNAHLKVLTVTDVRIFEWAVTIGVEGFAPIIPSTAYQEESQHLLEQKANEILKKTERMLREEQINFSLEKESGNPVDVICEKAKLVDMVLMGARGEFARWSEKMLGATIEAASRLCIKPILVTPKDFLKIEKILLAYDGSDNASKALTWSAFLASSLKMPLELLNVSASQQDGEELIKEAREYLNAYDIPDIKVSLETGDPVERIVAKARSDKSCLLVMGAYGHSRIREAILGSTTVQVTRKAEIPVLMAR